MASTVAVRRPGSCFADRVDAPGSPRPRIERFLNAFVTVRPGEATTALLLALNVFLILLAYYVLKTVREALILGEGSAELKSYLSAAQVVLLAGLVPFYGRLVAALSRIRLMNVVTAVFAAGLSATATAQPSTVILVRHAERAAEPTGDPVLTDGGMQRALDLKEALRGARVTAVITTHLQRTQLTAKPLADANGLSFIVVRAGGPTPAHVDSVAAAVRRRPPGDVVLVVGHSNTIPAIVGALGGPKLPDLCDTEYSMLYVLEFPASGPPRFIESRYGASNPPGDCPRTMR